MEWCLGSSELNSANTLRVSRGRHRVTGTVREGGPGDSATAVLLGGVSGVKCSG